MTYAQQQFQELVQDSGHPLGMQRFKKNQDFDKTLTKNSEASVKVSLMYNTMSAVRNILQLTPTNLTLLGIFSMLNYPRTVSAGDDDVEDDDNVIFTSLEFVLETPLLLIFTAALLIVTFCIGLACGCCCFRRCFSSPIVQERERETEPMLEEDPLYIHSKKGPTPFPTQQGPDDNKANSHGIALHGGNNSVFKTSGTAEKMLTEIGDYKVVNMSR